MWEAALKILKVSWKPLLVVVVLFARGGLLGAIDVVRGRFGGRER